MVTFGPRTQRVYAALRARILGGEFAPGARLPAHTELAAQFDVAPMTLRQVLDRLEDEGVVTREHGRGTFVRRRTPPAVLIVDDDPPMRHLLTEQVGRAGYRAVAAATPSDALTVLGREPAMSLVLSDVRMPTKADGLRFVRAVRQGWPDLPLAAITAYPDDLAELHGTPEYPILVLAKPVRVRQLAEVLHLVLRPELATATSEHSSSPGE